MERDDMRDDGGLRGSEHATMSERRLEEMMQKLHAKAAQMEARERSWEDEKAAMVAEAAEERKRAREEAAENARTIIAEARRAHEAKKADATNPSTDKFLSSSEIDNLRKSGGNLNPPGMPNYVTLVTTAVGDLDPLIP